MKEEKTNKSVRTFLVSEYQNLVLFVKRRFNEKYYGVSAEDIVQDVTLNIFSKIDFDEQFENIAGYIYSSIKNKITDLLRKNKKEINEERFNKNEEGKSYIENIPDIPDKELNEDILYEELYKALDKLSPNQQMIFIATEVEGYSYEELSERLKIPIGTLLSWKHRGVKKLRELIRLDDLYIDNEK